MGIVTMISRGASSHSLPRKAAAQTARHHGGVLAHSIRRLRSRNSGPPILAGTKVDNIGNVAVPIPEMSALMPMIGVVGFGAIGLALSYLRRRREG